MGIHHLFPWVYGVLLFSIILLIYIKVKSFERLSKRLGNTGGLNGELKRYKVAPHLYAGEFKDDINNALTIGKILNVFVILLFLFVAFTFVYFELKFTGKI